MPDSVYLNAWGAVTCHGAGARLLMVGLRAGISAPTEIPQQSWPVPANGRSLAFYAGGRTPGISARQLLLQRLETAWAEAMAMLNETERGELKDDCAMIFASTKGFVEDFVWETGNLHPCDPYTDVVEDFLRRTELRPKEWLTVSNACASSHSAIQLADEWLRNGLTRHVIVIAADLVGPFVLQGFHALHALSNTTIRPFDKNREGLLLGEAAVAAVFSRSRGIDFLRVLGASVQCEGHAVTRPESTGSNLQRAIADVLKGNSQPDAVIAHGTATQANDQVENLALCAQLPGRPWVAGTKWSVGHCLGASGLVDLVAAAEWLRSGEPFPMGGCENPDPAFHSRILTAQRLMDIPKQKWRSILVTALGFGGVHAAFLLAKEEDEIKTFP